MTREVTCAEAVEEAKYYLHIQLNEESQPLLNEAAKLAYKMGGIPEPKLT